MLKRPKQTPREEDRTKMCLIQDRLRQIISTLNSSQLTSHPTASKQSFKVLITELKELLGEAEATNNSRRDDI